MDAYWQQALNAGKSSMEPTNHHLKLCTFEVETHLGRKQRLGAHKEGMVLDLNFATAWYLAKPGSRTRADLGRPVSPK